nr:MAG TPA: hypothetical protein [Caudoviricetes sp.]
MGTVSWFPQVFDFTFQQPMGNLSKLLPIVVSLVLVSLVAYLF